MTIYLTVAVSIAAMSSQPIAANPDGLPDGVATKIVVLEGCFADTEGAKARLNAAVDEITGGRSIDEFLAAGQGYPAEFITLEVSVLRDELGCVATYLLSDGFTLPANRHHPIWDDRYDTAFVFQYNNIEEVERRLRVYLTTRWGWRALFWEHERPRDAYTLPEWAQPARVQGPRFGGRSARLVETSPEEN